MKFKFNHHHQLFVVKIFRICTISANHKKKGNVSWMSSSCAAISRVCVFVWHSIVFKTNSWSCSYCVLSATCGGTYQYLLSFRRGTRFPFGRSGCHRCGHTKWADGLVHVQKFFVRHLHDDVVLQIGFVLIIYKHHNIFCSVVSGEKVTLGFRNCTNIRRPKIE